MNKVRVRFAPSPTGALHIGGVRTALYNYLFAKKHGGELILRIEDTDSKRFVPYAEEYILNSFKWLGITFNEGVGVNEINKNYHQSARTDIYNKYVEQLVRSGDAYVAFDTEEELEEMRRKNPNFQYDSTTRLLMSNSLTIKNPQELLRLMETKPWVIRFKVRPNKEIIIKDLIRGEVKFNSSLLDDKVLYKNTDRLPTYHLANVVDDHLMEISHVIRGEEWLPSAPLHVLLYRAFGWEDTMPAFAHLPLLLKPEGNGKLSKRDGDRLGFPVFPLEWIDPKTEAISMGYKEKGFIPEALINFLALLGWNPGNNKEIMTMDELIESFDITKCSKAGAKFDYNKLKWFNHQYLINANHKPMALRMYNVLKQHYPLVTPNDALNAIELMVDRVDFEKDLLKECMFFFQEPLTYDEKAIKKHYNSNIDDCLFDFTFKLIHVDLGIQSEFDDLINSLCNKYGIKLGKIMNPIRLALVGKMSGPHIYDIIKLLGKTETIFRIEKLVKKMNKYST